MKRMLIVAFPVLFSLACIASTPAATQTAPSPTAEVIDTPGAVDTPTEGMVNVWVFFTMAADENMTPVPVARTVPQTGDEAALLRSTLNQLLQGPTDAEKSKGLTSWFSPATADAISGVAGAGGDYTVDFTGLNTIIPNASTSAGSQMLLSQLNSTVFQFDFVQSIGYSLDGDCAAFWEWLQMGCHTISRAEWEG